MPMYVIERNFAEQLMLGAQDVPGLVAAADAEGVRWLISFLSADKKKSYCIFESPDPEALMSHAARIGVPADVIVQVDEFRPEAYV